MKKELFWFLGTLLITVILNLFLFGFEGFAKNSTLDVNIHDTYFVIENKHIIITLTLLLLFIVYTVRALAKKFKNQVINVILILLTLALILLINSFAFLIEQLVQATTSWTIYPPLSQLESEAQQPKSQYNNINVLSNLVFVIQILLLLWLMFISFITGINFQSKKQIN